jgi:hypothetical protein
MRVIVVAVALLMLPPAESMAELPGSRVRVTMRATGSNGGPTEAKPLIGTVVRFDGDLLTLARGTSGETVILPVHRVAKLETLLRPSRKSKGAVIGACILGGAALALVGSVCASDWGCEGADPLRVALFVAVPAALGAGVGSSVADGARWKEVPLPTPRAVGSNRPRLRFGLTPDRRGVTASVSLPLFPSPTP